MCRTTHNNVICTEKGNVTFRGIAGGSSSSSEIRRRFPPPRSAVKPGVLFLKAADNVPAAINTYARVNTSRLSPRVKQLEGLPVPPFFAFLRAHASLPPLLTLYTLHFLFLFFPLAASCSSFFPCCVFLSRTTETMASEEEAENQRGEKRERAAGIFPVDIFLVGMRSRYVREALRSKRPRCSYRFHGLSTSVSRSLSPRETGFEIEHREQRELSRANSWLQPMR